MLNSAAEEISLWAERCRIWACGARTAEQRLMLRSLEELLSQAALDADQDLAGGRSPSAPAKS
jgi:hypothetical protein